MASSSVHLARCRLQKDAFCQSSLRRIYFYGNPLEKKLTNHTSVHCVAYICAVWPVYEVHKMPMFQWVGMREGGEQLPLAFQYLILSNDRKTL